MLKALPSDYSNISYCEVKYTLTHIIQRIDKCGMNVIDCTNNTNVEQYKVRSIMTLEYRLADTNEQSLIYKWGKLLNL